jgi:hypothetical protein
MPAVEEVTCSPFNIVYKWMVAGGEKGEYEESLHSKYLGQATI